MSETSSETIPTPEEIVLSEDGGIKKKILKEGSGECPPKGSKVKVHYVGKLLSGQVFDSSRDRGEFFEFSLGKGQVIKGWDIGVASMRVGEVAVLTCAPEYAYGERGSPPKIPPMSTLEFEVELFDFEEDDDDRPWAMNFEERLQTCQKRREEGNEHFTAKNYEKAISRYQKALAMFEAMYTFSEDEKRTANEAKVPIYLNMAMCQIKLSRFQNAIENCTKALEIDPASPKGLYRRGLSYVNVGNYEQAERDLNAALAVNPDSKEVKRELVLLKKKQEEYKQKEKKMFGKLFQ